jgi:hypothetical protein
MHLLQSGLPPYDFSRPLQTGEAINDQVKNLFKMAGNQGHMGSGGMSVGDMVVDTLGTDEKHPNPKRAILDESEKRKIRRHKAAARAAESALETAFPGAQLVRKLRTALDNKDSDGVEAAMENLQTWFGESGYFRKHWFDHLYDSTVVDCRADRDLIDWRGEGLKIEFALTEEFISAGGLEVTIGAMRTFPKNFVLGCGFLFISLIASYYVTSPSSRREELRRSDELWDSGAYSAIKGALARQDDNCEWVAANALYALWNLYSFNGIRKFGDVHKMVTSTMRKYSGDTDTVDMGILCIQKLCENDSIMRTSFGKEGAGRLVLLGLENLSTIRSNHVNCLEELCFNGANKVTEVFNFLSTEGINAGDVLDAIAENAKYCAGTVTAATELKTKFQNNSRLFAGRLCYYGWTIDGEGIWRMVTPGLY